VKLTINTLNLSTYDFLSHPYTQWRDGFLLDFLLIAENGSK